MSTYFPMCVIESCFAQLAMVIRLLIHPGATPKGGHGESFVAKKKLRFCWQLYAMLQDVVGCCWMSRIQPLGSGYGFFFILSSDSTWQLLATMCWMLCDLTTKLANYCRPVFFSYSVVFQKHAWFGMQWHAIKSESKMAPYHVKICFQDNPVP